MVYYAKIEKDDEGYFQVRFDDVSGAITYGNDLEHALIMAEEALNLVLKSNNIKFNKPTDFSGQAGYYPIQVKTKIAIALNLRWAREEQKLTQSDVAKRLNISFQVYQRYEDPAKNNVTADTIDRLQNALGIRLVTVG